MENWLDYWIKEIIYESNRRQAMKFEEEMREALENDRGFCDFSSPPHRIEAIKYVITYEEVKAYAEAYAEMIIREQMPYTELGKEMLRLAPRPFVKLQLVAFACGDDTVLVPKDKKERTIIVRNKSDWAICETCNRMWEQYKQKYPVEGN